jgi:hypothetical protein
MATATNTGNFSTESVKNKAGEVASNVADRARQTASDVADKARQSASDIAEKARQTASEAGKRAEDATHSVGSGMKSLADTIRDRGPSEGIMGAATTSLASGLECGGQYLEAEGLQGIAKDVTELVRRNPIPALLCGIGLGFLLARATTMRR